MTNWSVMLNVFLLAGVVFAIVRMIQMKRRASAPRPRRFEPALTPGATPEFSDDIIAVRKIESEPVAQPEFVSEITAEIQPIENIQEKSKSPTLLVVFLLAKEQRKLMGYELLQTILATGLRFGEGQLFHRHQFANGQGPVICSLATATADGTFDLQNMGAFSVHGLCMFMETSDNANIDLERFSIMMDTAKQLSEGLDTHLLDDERNPWSEASLARYHGILHVTEDEALPLV
ncbi:MAG: cell division protein ZipA C-terminal FtsZ-binding domain-containing protein [Legionellaceae bacterium]|nr:cell division protein ZipA C-terminal FtsZ-binding domain-containing protein [Legionellaceae bacterium]